LQDLPKPYKNILLSIIKKNTKIEKEFMKLRVRNKPEKKENSCSKISLFYLHVEAYLTLA